MARLEVLIIGRLHIKLRHGNGSSSNIKPANKKSRGVCEKIPLRIRGQCEERRLNAKVSAKH